MAQDMQVRYFAWTDVCLLRNAGLHLGPNQGPDCIRALGHLAGRQEGILIELLSVGLAGIPDMDSPPSLPIPGSLQKPPPPEGQPLL